jgi:phytoene dehydrogenase-like protein
VSDAIVVGSGPNGLACAVALAREGAHVTVLEAEETVGGGARSAELTVPGVVHDVCSAVHAMAAASPFLRSLHLERHGLEWCHAEVDLAHPMIDGTAAVMLRSIEETARGLGEDGPAWKRLFEAPAEMFEALNDDDLSRAVVHLPRHPIGLARFGLAAAAPADRIARSWSHQHAKALFGGVAAHALSRLDRPFSAAVGVALICCCHEFGWPVARGGSQAVSDALAADLREHGGEIRTGVRVRSLSEVEDADAVVLDLAPSLVADIAADRLPPRVERAYRRYRHGPAAFKVDYAVEEGIPWTSDACRRAGTLHLAGTFDEIAAAEREINEGRMPERPVVLVSQQYLADPGRSAGNVHPVWSYAHVPAGYDGDAEEAITARIERFAPGFRDRIVATSVQTPAELQASNANYIGGDILNGANTPRQLIFRPRVTLNPYDTGIPGVFLCSAATPPGPGVHGMCGYNASRAALRHLEKRRS